MRVSNKLSRIDQQEDNHNNNHWRSIASVDERLMRDHIAFRSLKIFNRPHRASENQEQSYDLDGPELILPSHRRRFENNLRRVFLNASVYVPASEYEERQSDDLRN